MFLKYTKACGFGDLLRLIKLSVKRLGLVTMLLLFSKAIVADVPIPVVVDGIIDLGEWHFDRDGSINLDGAWEFYWLDHLDSQQSSVLSISGQPNYLTVPGFWNDLYLDGEELSASGYATYRINILVSDYSAPLALKLPSIGTSYLLMVDGKALSNVGIPGTSKGLTRPSYKPSVIRFTPESNRVEVILQVANFHHRNGGIWEPVRLGTPQALHREREDAIAGDLLMFGAILIMGLYNLSAWVFRRESKSSLYLGGFCLLIATRILVVGERYVTHIAPSLGWEFLTRLEYVCWVLAVPMFLAFMRSLYRREARRNIETGAWLIASSFSVWALLAPIQWATQLVPLYQVITLLAIAYGVYVIVMAVYRKREGSILLGLGALILFVAAVNDMVAINFTLSGDNTFHIALFLFILMQSFLVSIFYSRAFRTIERQSSELTKTNLELHIQEKLRRTAEGESMALYERVDQTSKINRLGVIANTIISDLRESGLGSVPTRANAVLEDMVRLVQNAGVERAEIDIVELLRNFAMSMEYKALVESYRNAALVTDMQQGVGRVRGSASHLQTLVISLVRYVLETQPEGQVVILSGREMSVEELPLFHDRLPAGNYYVLRIADEGLGIHPEDLIEVFDPTQKSNAYSGIDTHLLHLAVVASILEDHGGKLDIYSAPQVTRLELYFPLVEDEQNTPPAS
jgi:signal transduction histidine kinase